MFPAELWCRVVQLLPPETAIQSRLLQLAAPVLGDNVHYHALQLAATDHRPDVMRGICQGLGVRTLPVKTPLYQGKPVALHLRVLVVAGLPELLVLWEKLAVPADFLNGCLEVACRYGKLEVAQWVLQEGSQLSVSYSKLAQVSVRRGHFGILRWLHRVGLTRLSASASGIVASPYCAGWPTSGRSQETASYSPTLSGSWSTVFLHFPGPCPWLSA
jgi:hypothetical protein